jgi:hypothetical protein
MKKRQIQLIVGVGLLARVGLWLFRSFVVSPSSPASPPGWPPINTQAKLPTRKLWLGSQDLVAEIARAPQERFCAVFGEMGGTASPPAGSYLRSPIGAAPEPPRSTLDPDRGYYGEAPGRPARRSGAGWEVPGASGSAVWGAKLGSEGSPRRERRVKGQSRGTAWRLILQASPVTIPSAGAMNRVLL